MSAGMAGSWWAIGLRSAAAILFAIVVLWLPPQAVAPLIFLFAALPHRRWRICDTGRNASAAMGIPLANAHPRGLCQSRSGGSGPRLAVGCRRRAGSDRHRVG